MTLPDPAESRVPIPDPTKLTIEAQEKAIAQGRLDLEAAKELIDFRIDRLRIDLDAIQSHHDQSLAHWMALIDEKFRGVEQRFTERDARAKDAAIASKNQYASDMATAQRELAAAFASAKELSALTSEHFKAEIEALKSQAGERGKSVDTQLAALDKSIDRGEPIGFGAGERAQKVERRQVDTLVISVLGLLFVALSAVFAVYVGTHR